MSPRSNSWSREDDLRLLELRAQGVKFIDIEHMMPGRSVAALQNRHSTLQKVGVEPEPDFDPNYAQQSLIRVPKDDPLLARLVKFHGNDKVERNMLKLMEASLG